MYTWHPTPQSPPLVASRTWTAAIRPSRLQPTATAPTTHEAHPNLRPILWRAGILILAAYFLFLALRLILGIVDPYLEVGVTLLLAGALFVLVSVVREQIEDARRGRSYENGSSRIASPLEVVAVSKPVTNPTKEQK